VLHAQPISLFSILSPERYWVRSRAISLLTLKAFVAYERVKQTYLLINKLNQETETILRKGKWRKLTHSNIVISVRTSINIS
jgi:hypothetical protein